MSRPSFALFITCVVLTGMVAPLSAGVGSAQEGLNVSLDIPQEATAGEETTISASVSVPDLPRDHQGELTTTVYIDGEQINSATQTIADGETTQIERTHTFSDPGSTTVRVEADLSIRSQRFTGSASRSIEVTAPETPSSSPSVELATVEGAAFTVPASLQDEVDAYRAEAEQDLEARAFILATQEDLYLVFTRKEPTKGTVSVEGAVLERDLSTENLTFGAIAATGVSFETTGTETTVQDVAGNSEEYRLELVRMTAHYRRASTLTDPDSGQNYTLASTSGILVNNPRPAVSLFQNAGSRARDLSRNTSADQVDTTLNDPRGTHLHTFSFEKKFWADAEATVDAIVIDPNSAARQFIEEYDEAGIAHAEDGEPVLYVVNEDFDPQSMDSVASIKSQSDSLDSEVVTAEVRLYQEQISVQETLEHNTGCDADLLEIQTPEGPVCVNVAQDNLLHGGAAWSSIPQSKEDVLFVMGVSSRHQDSPEEFEEGRYRITGEVVSTSRIDESLPEGSVLIIYEMERQGAIDYDAVASESRAIIETRTDQLASQLRKQVSDGEISIATEQRQQVLQSANPGEPATVSFSGSRGAVGVTQARINVSESLQNVEVSTSKITSLPSNVEQPPERSIQFLNISTTATDSSIRDASFRVRLSTSVTSDGGEVTVYRYHQGSWNALDTTVVTQTESELVIEVNTPGFSYFAVSTQAQATDAEDSSITEQHSTSDSTSSTNTDSTEQQNNSTEQKSTSTNGDGFTILALLAALFAFIGWRIRQ